MEIVFEIYSKDNCEWCVKTKELLSDKGLGYTEYKLGLDFQKENIAYLLGFPEKITLPQIFRDNKLIGGYEELLEYFENHGM